MKYKPTPDCEELGLSICEKFVTVVGGSDGPKEFQFFCFSWSCSKCRQWLIEIYKWKISRSLECHAGVQVFVDIRSEKGKELSNFLSSCKGLYYSIKTPDGTWVISTKNFPQAKRKDKKKFIEEDLPKILDTPWTGGKRVNSSSELKNFWRNLLLQDLDYKLMHYMETNGFTNVRRRLAMYLIREVHQENKGYWGMILGKREFEFSELDTFEQRVQWFADNRNNTVKIYGEGERVLSQMILRVPPDSTELETGQGEEERERIDFREEELYAEQ